MKQRHILAAAAAPVLLVTVFRATVNAGPEKPAASGQLPVTEWLGAGFQGMSLFDVLLSAALIGLVVAAERLLRWLVWHRVRRRAEQEGRAPAAIFFLDALSTPFSVAFLAYGIYFSLWPVYGAFETPAGNAILDACHGGARLIAYVAAVWFFVRLLEPLTKRELCSVFAAKDGSWQWFC